VLASHPDIDNVGVANSFQMLLRLVAETEPDIVLLDESLLDRRADRLRWLLNSHPNTNVIVEVNSEELAFCLSLLRAGARAVIPRLVAPAQLAQCIQSVAKGSHWISGKVLGWLIDDWQTHRPMRSEVSLELPHFNARETMVMSMIVRGRKNSEMAAGAWESPTGKVFAGTASTWGYRLNGEMQRPAGLRKPHNRGP
jgi:DNA-binding NarL/FixJ family response regulator